MPDYRLRLPSAVLRLLQQRAGDQLQTGLRRLAELWADGSLDPLADDPIGGAIARRGGQARAAALSPMRRREIAHRAAQARWSQRDQDRER